jgi:hypothetical protein
MQSHTAAFLRVHPPTSGQHVRQITSESLAPFQRAAQSSFQLSFVMGNREGS